MMKTIIGASLVGAGLGLMLSAASAIYTDYTQRMATAQIEARAESAQSFCGELLDTLKARKGNET